MPQEEGTLANNTAEYGDADNVYPFGVDPAWHIAENEVKSTLHSHEIKHFRYCGLLVLYCFVRASGGAFALSCIDENHVY